MASYMRCVNTRVTSANTRRKHLRQTGCGPCVHASRRASRFQLTTPECSAVSSTAEGQPADDARPAFISKIRDFFCPFHDGSANSRFMALALGGMLCSIATLIHDSYLPVFMRDELGMSNSVCHIPVKLIVRMVSLMPMSVNRMCSSVVDIMFSCCPCIAENWKCTSLVTASVPDIKIIFWSNG